LQVIDAVDREFFAWQVFGEEQSVTYGGIAFLAVAHYTVTARASATIRLGVRWENHSVSGVNLWDRNHSGQTLVNARFGCHQLGGVWIRGDESDSLNLPPGKLFNQPVRRGKNCIDAMLGQKSLEFFPEAGAVEFRTEQVVSQDHAGGVEFDFKTAAPEQMNLVALYQCVDNFEAGLVAGWEDNYSIHELSLEENGAIIPQFQRTNSI
jgi:hypothetical protein